ncbi:hypothetical protein KUCAC02_037258, partial [Chaenocephalus aceratus]
CEPLVAQQGDVETASVFVCSRNGGRNQLKAHLWVRRDLNLWLLRDCVSTGLCLYGTVSLSSRHTNTDS